MKSWDLSVSKLKTTRTIWATLIVLEISLISIVSANNNIITNTAAEDDSNLYFSSTKPSVETEVSTKRIDDYLEFMCDEETIRENSRNIVNSKCEITKVKSWDFYKEKDLELDHEQQWNYKIGQKSHHRNEFCIVSDANDTLKFKICPKYPELVRRRRRHQNHSNHEITIKKCCNANQRLMKYKSENDSEHYSCVDVSETWNPAVYSNFEDDYNKHSHLNNISENLNYEIGFPNCSDFHQMNNTKDIWFKILKDGQVFVGLKFWFRPVWLPVQSDNHGFCLDEISNTTTKVDSHEIYHKNQILFYCHIERFNEYLFHRKLFGSLCITASAIILFLLIIYISIWDKQNLAGWTQFNIFTALFFVFGMEGTRTLVDYNGIYVESTTSCTIIAAIAQYFFFALNTTWCVMNFDLFWTFWKLESNLKGTKGNGKRIIAYLFFSWGIPLIVVAGAFGWSHSIAMNEKSQMMGIYALAHRRCSSPIRELGFKTQGLMFLVNLIFFSLTAFLLWKHRRGISGSRKNSKSEKHTWRSVMLFAKLLVVMGVSSLSIPLDYFFGSDDPLNPFEVLFRAVHFIPVVAILFIFGFNEKNVRLIKQKYPNFSEALGFNGCAVRPGTTDTNHSPSAAGPNSTEIKEIPCTK